MLSTMKNKIITAMFVLVMTSSAWADEQLAQVGLMVVPGGSLAYAGLEMKKEGDRSITARVGTFSYEISDDGYEEWGDGMILGVGTKFFSNSDQVGGYFGVNLDYVSVDGGWYEYYSYGWFSGSGIVPGVTVGNRMKNGDNFIEPNMYIGSMSAGENSIMLIALGITISF